MHIPLILTALLAPLTVLSTPINTLTHRQSRPTKPPPCTRLSNTTEPETALRASSFAQAFIYQKNITAAFTYIALDYINHNPSAQNGFDSAWNILSPIWGSQSITPIRTKWKEPQSWLNYRTGAFGEVVDRFRWEGGCIVEHWDQGRSFHRRGCEGVHDRGEEMMRGSEGM